MSNEHHQSGRRPNKAELERLQPEHRDKQPLKKGNENERRNQPTTSKQDHQHSGLTPMEEVRRIDTETAD